MSSCMAEVYGGLGEGGKGRRDGGSVGDITDGRRPEKVAKNFPKKRPGGMDAQGVIGC